MSTPCPTTVEELGPFTPAMALAVQERAEAARRQADPLDDNYLCALGVTPALSRVREDAAMLVFCAVALLPWERLL